MNIKVGDKVYVWHTSDINVIQWLLSLLHGFDTVLEVTEVDIENNLIWVSGYEFPLSYDEVIRCW